MMPRKTRHFIFAGLIVIGWSGALLADDDVTVISTPSNTPAKTEPTTNPDGTPVVHKSSHKKKKTATASTAPATSNPTTASSVTPAQAPLKPARTPDAVVGPALAPPPHAPMNPTRTVVILPPPLAPPSVINLESKPQGSSVILNSPSVSTGLPVARYAGFNAPITGVSTYSPMPTVLPPASRMPYYAISTPPSSILPASGPMSNSHLQSEAMDDFTFASTSRKRKNVYPWKLNIITTIFWIGEGSTPISSTTNVESSWDEDWRANNHGSDSPNDRNGYASGSHASTLNPFYVALPFNDLAFPDKTRRWLPDGWYRRARDGKQVSACKDRWVEIKNSRGDICYAQWEDVGPLRYDHAEYVFGPERPIGLGDDHAGLDVSPAVAEYLGIDHKDHATTSWRFVDDEDVRPGAWLKLDEQAVLYTALHQLKNTPQAIERNSEPTEDQNDEDSNKKKLDASKG
jgi:hypothetical protein